MEASRKQRSVLWVTGDASTAAWGDTETVLDLTTVTSMDAAFAAFDPERYDAIVSAYDLPDSSGVAFLESFRVEYPDFPFILYTTGGSESIASRAIAADVTEYVPIEDSSQGAEILQNRLDRTLSVNGLPDGSAPTPPTDVAAILETVTDAILISVDGALEYANPAATNLLGLTDGESVTLSSVIGSGDERDSVAAEHKMGADANVTSLETRLTPRDDDPFQAHVIVRAVIWQGEDGIAWVIPTPGIDRDDADTKEKRALRERTKELSAIHRTVTLVDSGVPPAELFQTVATILSESFQFPSATTVRIAYDEIEETAGDFDASDHLLSETMADVDGQALTLEVGYLDHPTVPSTDPFLQEEEKLLQTLGTVLVSYLESQEYLDELERHKELLRNAEQLGNVGVWESNLDTGETYWSEGTRRIHEVSEDFEPSIESTIQFFDESAQKKLMQTVQSCLETGEPFSETYRITTPNGRQKWVRIHGEIVGDDPPILRGYTHAITDRIENRQRLAVLDRVLRHNLRNDMNVIMSQAELLRENLDADVDDQIDVILSRAEELLELTDKQRMATRLLSKPQAPPGTDLHGAIDRSVDRLKEQHPSASVTVTPMESTVLATPYIEDVIDELLDNAVRHSDRAEPSVEIAVAIEADRVEISVADDGSGIPDHELDPLEDDRLRDELDHGSGIGLWVVKWLVTRARGSMDFEENEPRGSIVRITLPRDSASVDIPETDPEEAIPESARDD